MIRITLLTFLVALASTISGHAAAPPSKVSNPDFTKGESIPEGATHDWNLGPTGARGWMYSNKLETSEARQIMITTVDPGSPADGVLAPGDVILGAGGRLFKTDPRTEFGQAVGLAEKSSGRLVLIRWRDGRRTRVAVKLPTLGRYAATAPFDCSKSTAILEQGCAALARRMAANPEKGSPIERCYNALALLSSGNEEYLPLVRQQVEAFSTYSDLERRGLHSWWYGPINILLAEYVLATGDRTFMPNLERITGEIVEGQSEVGSWGHRMVQTNGRLSGYGMMNAPGLPMTISLVLARKAGVEHPDLDDAIEKSARLMRFYVGKGSVPYGDHHPWIETHDDNGKNGAAAVLFNLLGDAEAAEYFSRMSVASHGNERDNGHTGNYFNMLWAMPGVALSGSDASGAWMEEFGWYYDLARRWDGTFQHQGPPQAKPDSYRNWDATGAMLLAYAQPLGRIHLTGRTPSTAPEVDRRTAEDLVADGRDWGSRTRLESWSDRSNRQLLRNLESWSPVVRERAAIELARRDGDPTASLRKMLRRDDPYARLGACQAAIMLKERAAPLVDELRVTLESDDLWTRAKAAEAIAAIGGPAMPALPDLLAMLAEPADASDPRRMEQRYLCFALFDRRDGMLGRSLEGVDRDDLLAAVAAGLRNEDGRARGAVRSVYQNLSFEAITPLLPAIHEAMIEPAPSGIMFADEIRLAGLDLFAEHGIEEGVPWCVTMIDPERWGMGNRIERSLNALRVYGGAARGQIPRLKALQAELEARKWNPERLRKIDIPGRIREIENDDAPRTLRRIDELTPRRAG
ncbi:MAG: PDZ domain-containing protein [Phycisphaeraceae bacterium]|nr:PDZ domain-containing protein [Phycisphaeraceae bacterium]